MSQPLVAEGESESPGAILSSGPNERLSVEAFHQLAGQLAGYPFVKVVVVRGEKPVLHFLNHARFQFHADYIAERILRISPEQLDREIDTFNRSFYLVPDRKFFLGIIALHVALHVAQTGGGGERFATLETVEIDNMDASMVLEFHAAVKSRLDPELPLYFKPGNHLQEAIAAEIPREKLPRVHSHELFAQARFVPLNPGVARGRLRSFPNLERYRAARPTLEWYDIIVMHRVPDDIPRLSGIINAEHTTPLSHTNVLAHGWQIPNSIQLGIFERVVSENLDGRWVEYSVDAQSGELGLRVVESPAELPQRPAWSVQRIQLEEPETAHTPILELDLLRSADRYRYGTKAANLGELRHVLDNGSERLLGFYKIRRPPRANLLGYLAARLGLPETADHVKLARSAGDFLRANLQIPRGIALPFSVQQEFLESSPRIQQTIGKLKMALELGAREVEALCLQLQTLIRGARIPEKLRGQIDAEIANHLSGVSSFVVRSSSNAEDLEGFSAAGIYESINHVTTADNIFQSIKEVWASLVSPRSVRLRHEVGISLDACYMGVIVQEEVRGTAEQGSLMGGVLVTTNPMARGDFRNVYVNVSPRSVISVVQGSELPLQYLFNVVEGGGRTLSLGSASEDLAEDAKDRLQRLVLAGRLLQSHFSPDYTFSAPVDIEWISVPDGLFILQLRPYSK
jgi:hypothetical protein